MVRTIRFGGVRSIRTRILASFIALIVLSAALSMVAIREVMLLQLKYRLEAATEQEFAEMRKLIDKGVDPRTGRTFTSAAAVFDVFFERNVPSKEEGMVAFVDGQAYRTSLDRLAIPRLPDHVMQRLSSSVPTSPTGRRLREFDTDLGPAYYAALPVAVGGGFGTFVVVFLPVEEREEISELQSYGVTFVILVALAASGAAWWLTGRLLGPVRSLTQTAQLISQSDLKSRIPVRGDDEAGEMARTFNAMLDRLEAVFAREREFLLDASHELRVPLTIALGNLSLSREGVHEPDEEKQVLTLVMDELERMARLVNDLQLLADAQNPRFLQLEPFDLEAFTHELAAKVGPLGNRTWVVDGTATGVVAADRHRLTEAVVSLAQNAIQNTGPDDVVALGTAHDERGFTVWVRDTGGGVATEDQPYIFDRFRRGSGAHLRYRGSGIGLSIVQAIARAHGGRAEVRSRPGEGATFTLRIPTEVTTVPPVPVVAAVSGSEGRQA